MTLEQGLGWEDVRCGVAPPPGPLGRSGHHSLMITSSPDRSPGEAEDTPGEESPGPGDSGPGPAPGRRLCRPDQADDITPMAESEEELKSLLMKVKVESEKVGLKAQHSENEDHGIWSHHFMGNRWGNSRNSVRLYFLRLQSNCRW